ncbi:MAG: LysR family transcriptional regulator [Elainellaceae cyanobacterium]
MPRKRPFQLSLSHLHTLIAVAETGSFSDAALQLELSQSAVSNAIATLESDLGVSLFLRGRHGATLTPIGDRILTHARHMMLIQSDLIKDANRARSLEGGQVRITSFRSISTQVLPEVLAEFQRRFPDISVDLRESTNTRSIADDLRKGLSDIGFIDEAIDDEFETWEFMRDEFVVLLSQGYAKDAEPHEERSRDSITWDELTRYPLIMATEGDNCDRKVYAYCNQFNQQLRVSYHVKNDSTIVGMVARGLGGTIIPRLAAEPLPANLKVFSLPVPLFRTIEVATLAKALHPPPVFAFLELLKEARG